MKNKDIIIINNKKFDGKTGFPIEKIPQNPNVPIDKVDNTKLKTNKLINQKSIKNGIMFAKKVGQTMDIARSRSISHFAPKISSKSKVQPEKNDKKDTAPIRHPLVAKVESKRFNYSFNRSGHIKSKMPNTAKESPTTELFKKATDSNNKKKPIKRSLKIIYTALFSILAIIITGYLIYSLMPSLSVRIASAQAGINATYPEYCPDGYKPSGPVSYSDNVVTIDFRANTGDNRFTISQSKSSWDSSAVKVKAEQEASGEVITTSEKGLTIFTYKNNAMWVNGGILYSISSDAPLSGEQIRHIATSL